MIYVCVVPWSLQEVKEKKRLDLSYNKGNNIYRRPSERELAQAQKRRWVEVCDQARLVSTQQQWVKAQ